MKGTPLTPPKDVQGRNIPRLVTLAVITLFPVGLWTFVAWTAYLSWSQGRITNPGAIAFFAIFVTVASFVTATVISGWKRLHRAAKAVKERE